VYNPFEILGLSDSSSEKQIKKHYKQLSLQLCVSPSIALDHVDGAWGNSHPDKIRLAENQTKSDADAKFVKLTKAYKSLTDEVTRDNLAKYGNPDGPQQREDKIAIPQWVVEGSNGNWVLAAYGLVLGGGIPFVVVRQYPLQAHSFIKSKLADDGAIGPMVVLTTSLDPRQHPQHHGRAILPPTPRRHRFPLPRYPPRLSSRVSSDPWG
jgi:preprotein translocase subunit Sec63